MEMETQSCIVYSKENERWGVIFWLRDYEQMCISTSLLSIFIQNTRQITNFVELLVNNGAFKDVKNESTSIASPYYNCGVTPLQMAVEHGLEKIAIILINSDAADLEATLVSLVIK